MNIAIILAGGIGSRMRSDGFPKQYIDVAGKPVIVYTLEKFEACHSVDKIIVVAHMQWKKSILDWATQYGITKLSTIAEQGQTRQHSVLNGLVAAEAISKSTNDIVLIHDSARPLVTTNLIESCVECMDGYDACLPVIPMKDTIYHSIDGNSISNLMDRSTLYCGQSPEAFYLHSYLELTRSIPEEELSSIRGCCELAYQHKYNIRMIPGEETNFKLTTADDLVRLTKFLEQ